MQSSDRSGESRFGLAAAHLDAAVDGDRLTSLFRDHERIDVKFVDEGKVGHELGETQERLLNLGDVGGRRAAGALKKLVGLDRADHVASVGVRDGCDAEGDVLHDLDEDAAEAEHQHRAVLRVGGDAADHFAGAFDHFLNDDAFKPVEQAALVELGDEVAVFGAKRLG